MTKNKTTSLPVLIAKHNFDYVDSSITAENFPPQPISLEFKVFDFGREISAEDVIKEMAEAGYRPANIYELLSWDDWNGKDWVVGLVSSWRDSDGNRCVPGLGGWGGRRRLLLYWIEDGWGGHCRFLAVRKSSDLDYLEPKIDDLDLAIAVVKQAGYVVSKVM
jgi:hypothetical protein